MVIYRYALHAGAGENEHLGFIDIRSDGEAIEFGQEVIDDLRLEYRPAQEPVTLEISAGPRHVGSVPLAADVLLKACG